MNPSHIKQDRPDLMADPLRAVFTSTVSTEVPWWYRIWIWTLPYRWRLARKARIANQPPTLLAVLITDSDLMDAVIFGTPLSRKQRWGQLWSKAWRWTLFLALGVAVVWLAFATPEAFQ